MQLTTNLCHYSRFASLRCIPLSNLQRDLEIHFLKLYALRTEKKSQSENICWYFKTIFKKIKHILLISYFAMLSNIIVRLKTAKTVVCKTPSFS